MTGSTDNYAPHPHIGGRTAALRALAAWRTQRPGSPRVVLLTGSSGSGRSRLLTGFLMLCDPEFRKQLILDELDPSTVPPELPAPAVPSAKGLTSAQFLWVLADHYGLDASDAPSVYAELARLGPLTIVVPDVDRAGPVRAAEEPVRLVRDVLARLAAAPNIRLLVEVPRELVVELGEGLPPGTTQVIDLDDPEWADPEAIARQAEAMLNPAFLAPDLPFTTDAAVRRTLAEKIGRRAGSSPLVAELAVNSILTAPEGVDPDDERLWPTTIGEALDLHARRLGADPQLLRLVLAPLALAEGQGLPVELWAPLASAVAGRDMRSAIANGMALAGPFVQPLEIEEDPITERTLIRLLHPAIADQVQTGLPDIRAAQARIAMALLQSVPDQDWGLADPYVCDHIAAHALEAGLLPQLLTDPGLFVHADPVTLRAALESVPVGTLGAPALTYLRTAPLLTRTQGSELLRAALLESAFVEDGLPEYCEAVHRLGLDLPWRTLWSVSVPGVSEVTIARVPGANGTDLPVAVLVVPAGTPGAQSAEATGDSAVLVHGLLHPGTLLEGVDLAQVVRPSEEERAASPFGLSRGSDYVRVWDRANDDAVTALICDSPITSVDLSPEGILLVATARGARALRIHSDSHRPSRHSA
ncbi:hypothetical protein AR457_31375 [Streptomyces agglomeratus]|uniref:ATP-binding protein n=1 Tax=Streptomyces agglomeratus TaxID=285458 RepID=A0A1E5PFI4_9ACTN|nr:hypothetical protein [Streptomyces agglomeratus]OEJ28300.1 hypothetical protein AS594_31270 [Streptomyces agglomeratus]OEJ37635.1 hypothetical protein BGK70_05270 [Streptomyces agglomeratus]OEJ47978.1 hypothetical protein AR457_31375 [Streptomyces agglomeratus]OEJ57503.1 hypothetical protein BGM19_05465 [Streptomyces agglomeratus]